MPEPSINEARVRQAVEEAVDQTTQEMVDQVCEAVCDIIRAICMGDPALYRPMLELIAQCLGEV